MIMDRFTGQRQGKQDAQDIWLLPLMDGQPILKMSTLFRIVETFPTPQMHYTPNARMSTPSKNAISSTVYTNLTRDLANRLFALLRTSNSGIHARQMVVDVVLLLVLRPLNRFRG